MSDDQDIAVFKANFPPIQSAILISGDGNGGSIKLAVPEMEMDIFTQLIGMRRAELIVTIQVAQSLKESKENGSTEINNRAKGNAPTASRRRVQRPTDT